MHEAAAPHLYRNAHLANLPSFFCGINTAAPPNRTGKRGLLRLVKRMTLYNPRATIPSSSRREPSPTVFVMDPVYPFPDRKTIRLVDETLGSFAGLASILAEWSGEALLPQLVEFTSTSLNTDKWDPIEKFILSGSKEEKRYSDFRATSTIVHSLIRQASGGSSKRHWRFWPVSGPYTNAVEALASASPSQTSATQYIDQYPSTIPPISRNTVIILKPLVREMTFGRYLNWPELRSRIAKLTKDVDAPMQVDVGCRLVPNPKRIKDYGKIDSEVNWELDQIDEINDMLEVAENDTWRVSTKMVWVKDAVLPEKGEERRGR